METRRTSMLIEEGLYERVRRLAEERGTTFRSIAESAIAEYVAKADAEDTRTVEERFPFIGIWDGPPLVPEGMDFNDWIDETKQLWADKKWKEYQEDLADLHDRIRRRDLPGLEKILREEEGIDLDTWVKREGLDD